MEALIVKRLALVAGIITGSEHSFLLFFYFFSHFDSDGATAGSEVTGFKDEPQGRSGLTSIFRPTDTQSILDCFIFIVVCFRWSCYT